MIRLLAALLLLCPIVAAEEPFLPADIALDVVTHNVPAAEWKQCIKSADNSFKSWQNDNPDGNRKRFLDDKLLQIAHAVPADVQTLKKYVMWLALYSYYNEPTPHYLNGGGKYKLEIQELVERDFTWDKALAALLRHAHEIEENQIEKASR